MRIVLAFDKFKGTLTALEACEATQRGLSFSLEQAAFQLCPIADGGDGTVEALAATSKGRMITTTVENAVGSGEVSAQFWLGEDGIATLEMAAASGLALLSESERDPSKATTFGTAQLMQAALDAGASRLVLGLGGSATNDGGLGMARGFGYQFLNAEGKEIDQPIHLTTLERIVPPTTPTSIACTVLVDVNAPLLGSEGATAIFGPQKGVDSELAPKLEAGLEKLADVAARDLGKDHRETPGAGAAGGLGYGLLTFCQTEMVPGFDFISKRIGLEAAIAKADWVITGEGSMDRQTLTGKGPHGVAKLALAHGKNIGAIAGAVPSTDRAQLAEAFPTLLTLTEEAGVEEAMKHPAQTLELVAKKLANYLTS